MITRGDRFDKLTRVRKKALDQSLAALARIEKSQLEESRKLDYLQTVRAEYAQRSPIAVSNSFELASLQRALQFNDRLDQAIGEQARRVESVGAEVARRRQAAIEGKRALETLDKLIERQSRARSARQLDLEQKSSDEFAAIRSTKTQGETS